MGMTGTVEGAGRLALTLGHAADQLADLGPVDREVGQLVLGAVDPPRRTGALASTVDAVDDAGGVTLTAGSPAVPYAGVIHEGWPAHHIRAQPFMTKAIDKTTDEIANRYERHVDEALSTVKGA